MPCRMLPQRQDITWSFLLEAKWALTRSPIFKTSCRSRVVIDCYNSWSNRWPSSICSETLRLVSSKLEMKKTPCLSLVQSLRFFKLAWYAQVNSVAWSRRQLGHSRGFDSNKTSPAKVITLSSALASMLSYKIIASLLLWRSTKFGSGARRRLKK